MLAHHLRHCVLERVVGMPPIDVVQGGTSC